MSASGESTPESTTNPPAAPCENVTEIAVGVRCILRSYSSITGASCPADFSQFARTARSRRRSLPAVSARSVCSVAPLGPNRMVLKEQM